MQGVSRILSVLCSSSPRPGGGGFSAEDELRNLSHFSNGKMQDPQGPVRKAVAGQPCCIAWKRAGLLRPEAGQVTLPRDARSLAQHAEARILNRNFLFCYHSVNLKAE